MYKDPSSIYMNETYISKLENATTDIDIEASTFYWRLQFYMNLFIMEIM